MITVAAKFRLVEAVEAEAAVLATAGVAATTCNCTLPLLLPPPLVLVLRSFSCRPWGRWRRLISQSTD